MDVGDQNGSTKCIITTMVGSTGVNNKARLSTLVVELHGKM